MSDQLVQEIVKPYEIRLNSDWEVALSEGSRHFEEKSEVQDTLRKIAKRLTDLEIAYAVAGGMALFRHGFRRFTEDVDILVTRASLRTIHERLEGLGYVSPFTGSKNLRDTEHGVRIEFLIAGEFPGDGKPKPVAFPEPADAAVAIDGVNYLSLPRLVELKLASGMTGGVARLKDFADVVALVTTLDLPRAFSEQLNPYVQPKYFELWDGIQASPEHPSDR